MTRHEAHDDAERAQEERRRERHRARRSRPQAAARGSWRCPRCGEASDPRNCGCMRQLRRRLDEIRRHLRRGSPGAAEVELACASELLDLLQKDAIKASGGNSGG
jgi:hypothetical protein